MNIDEIRELIQLAKETGIASLDVQRGNDRVRIRLTSTPVHQVFVPAQHAPKPELMPMQNAAPALPVPVVPEAEPATDSNLVLVRSPIVGTFYESPSPGSPPFVRIGEHVQPGKVLCIIESMKLMNEIEAEIAGIVESKLVMNGKPVEYGEALFEIRPV
jgi:acetyl-CoA carboxylase biotin carboxyl carrier protein